MKNINIYSATDPIHLHGKREKLTTFLSDFFPEAQADENHKTEEEPLVLNMDADASPRTVYELTCKILKLVFGV